MESLFIYGTPVDYYRVAFDNGTQVIFRSLPKMLEAPLDSQSWMDDKYLFKKKAGAVNIPVSKGRSCWSLSEAHKIFDELQKPVIVKPRQGSRGKHTTTWIKTKEELATAYKSAKQLCACVMVEEHLIGSVYRGTVINGIVAGILAGDQPWIVGNGVNTIRELIDIKNQTKPDRVGNVVITQKMENFVKRLGYTLDSVLEDGKKIEVSEKIGLSYGGDARDVTKETHPKIIEYVRLAGELVKDPILGFDFIIPDISGDPDIQQWGFIECNGLPFINLHHDPRTGDSINVAGLVWDYVESEIAKHPSKKLWICI